LILLAFWIVCRYRRGCNCRYMLKNVYFISFFISVQRNLLGKTASIGFLILKNIDLLMFSLRMPMDVTPNVQLHHLHHYYHYYIFYL